MNIKLLRFILAPLMKIRFSKSRSLVLNMNSYFQREHMLRFAMQFVSASKLKGDYLEFGVYKGKTFAGAYHLAQAFNLDSMHFYAFDSFSGLPEIAGIDAAGFKHFEKNEYSCDLRNFTNNIYGLGVDKNKVHITTGWFDKVLNENTMKKLPLEKASVIWIDSDLYESAVPVLNFITDYLQNGTLIIFDDWFCFRGDPEKGEQKAFKEWLENNPQIKVSHYQKFNWQGNSFIVHVD